jgi:hypothetical protein
MGFVLINLAQIFPPPDRYYADCVIGGEGASRYSSRRR